MRIAWWRPNEENEPRFEQPYLELPSPYDHMPIEPPREEAEEEDSPRVIIIEI
jgi:hypothetical protein